LGKFFDRLARDRAVQEQQYQQQQQDQFSREQQFQQIQSGQASMASTTTTTTQTQQNQQMNQQGSQQGLLPSMDIQQGTLLQTANKLTGNNNANQQPQQQQQQAQRGSSRPGQSSQQGQQGGGPGQGSFFSAFFGDKQGGQGGQSGGLGITQNTSNPYAKGGDKQGPRAGNQNPFGQKQQQQQQLQQQQQQQSMREQRQREEQMKQQQLAEKQERERIEYERQKLARPQNMMRSTDVSDKDLFEAELIKDLMDSYFNIVRRNILDTVPKSIMYYLVNDSKNRIQNELVAALYKEELFSELLEEGPQVASKRQHCQKMLDVLKKAHRILNEVRDFSVPEDKPKY